MACFGWSAGAGRHDFEIVGTEAKLLWDSRESGPVVTTARREVTHLDLPNADNAHLPLVQDFVDAALGGREPVCSLREAVKTNVLMDAIYASAAAGCEVEVRA